MFDECYFESVGKRLKFSDLPDNVKQSLLEGFRPERDDLLTFLNERLDGMYPDEIDNMINGFETDSNAEEDDGYQLAVKRWSKAREELLSEHHTFTQLIDDVIWERVKKNKKGVKEGKKLKRLLE
jgi:hypothetical protein